jgi:hypothetical protein
VHYHCLLFLLDFDLHSSNVINRNSYHAAAVLAKMCGFGPKDSVTFGVSMDVKVRQRIEKLLTTPVFNK